MRKFYIGFISLAVVLAIYLLYSRLDTTTLPDTAKQADFIDTVTDSNLSELSSKVGIIGDVGVGNVEKANFITYNENQEVVREIGFERLLSKSSDIWETEKPFINIYRNNFICNITADTGTILVETAVGETTPKDATFTSNVVVHIVPVGSGTVKESYIYLDDITFLSDKSLLSTANSARYVSEDARMTGTGLELVYDDVLERLEYLWIIDLESLHIKKSETAFLTGSKKPAEKQVENSADTNDRAETKQPNEPAVASDTTTAQVASTQPSIEQRKGEYYNCVFSENVFIDDPEQLVFAQDKIFINDIIWPKASSSQPGEADTDTKAVSTDQSDKAAKVVDQSPQIADNTDADTNTVAVAKPGEPNESPDKPQETVITCDNGFIVALKDSPKVLEKLAKTAIGTAEPAYRRPEKFDRAEGRKTFLSRKIDYNALTDDVIATGASELKFYTDDLGQPDPNKPPLPVTVTAQQRVRFLPASNQAVFEGNCQAEIFQTDPNFLQQYKLLAPMFTINLAKDANDRTSASTPGIEHFTADGGLVRLVSKKTAGQKQLGGIQLESRKFDYDPGKGLFVATGPGIIQMDNSNIPPSTTETGKFSLSKPCYAVVREFETLKYFIQKNQIVADAPSEEGLIIDYFPALNGKPQLDQQATVTTPHIQADLIKTASGQSKLSTLSATGGIVYVDQDKQFEGSTLFYDAGKSLVTVKGDQLRPCSYNGAFAGAIEWDLKTDNIKTDVAGPAILQLK
ncbi:MAG: hypothetical protein GY845_16285 [Planctomycetes bacterium]|nr:hypothetical protein [Planctomycetota bacterium]